jgi:hypothetical protein
MSNLKQRKAGFYKLFSGRLYALLLVLVILLPLTCSPRTDTGLSGTVADTNGRQLSGVTVTCGTISGTSSGDGSFKLALNPGLEQIVIFSGTGLIPCSWRVNVYKGHTSFLPVTMKPRTKNEIIDSSSGGTANGPQGATITTPPDSFVDATGAPVSGEVEVSLTPLDPANPRDAAACPGELSGQTLDGQSVPLISYGVLDILVTKNGKPLQIAPGKTVDLAIPAASSGPLPAAASLWYFNEKQAQWLEVSGQATYDAGTNTFGAAVSHLTSYTVARAIDPSCVNGMVQDAQAKPVVGATVTAQKGDSLDSQGIYAMTQTDENGNFCLTTEREKPVLLTVTDASGTITTRAFIASATRSNQYPADCSQTSCLQLKTIVTGTPDPGQNPSTADCNYDPSTNPFIGTCAEGLGDFYVCYHPEGECFYRLDYYGASTGNASYEISFENGARMEFTADILGGSIISLYGPDPLNKLCGTMTGTGEQTSITTESGQTYILRYNSSGAVEVVCPGGSSFVLNGAQKDALYGCNGTISDAGSSGTGGGVTCRPYPGSFMSPCTVETDCETGYQCCGPEAKNNSKCVPPDMCSMFEEACSSDDDCPPPQCDTEGNCISWVCCPMVFFNIDMCVPAESCPVTGIAALREQSSADDLKTADRFSIVNMTDEDVSLSTRLLCHKNQHGAL